MSEQSKKTACVSRYQGQKILIGDSIIVRVSKVDGKRVYLYVEGPEGVSISRPSKEDDDVDRELGKIQRD